MRAVIVGLGVAVLGYGGWLLLSRQDLVDVREVVLWAAVAVVLHDAVLAPLVLALGWVARRLVAGRLAAAAVVVLVVLGPVALAAIPVLGRYGAEPGNATLLARDYPQGLIVVALVAVVAATVLVLAGLVSEEERGRSSGGPGPGRR